MKVAADADAPESAGRGRRRLRRRRTRLSDAAAHRGRGSSRRSTRTSPSTRPTPAPTISSAPSVERYRADYGIDYAPSEVIVTAGGKQALFNAIMAIFERGRRGHHPRAGLAHAGRADQAGGRNPRDRSRARRRRLRAACGDVPVAPSRRGRAGSSSTRRPTRPARSSPKRARPPSRDEAAKRGHLDARSTSATRS